MITIATFDKPEQAHLVRTRLEAVGIPAFVQDENDNQIAWLSGKGVGSIRLEVADEQEEEAREFLAEDAAHPVKDGEIEPPAGQEV